MTKWEKLPLLVFKSQNTMLTPVLWRHHSSVIVVVINSSLSLVLGSMPVDVRRLLHHLRLVASVQAVLSDSISYCRFAPHHSTTSFVLFCRGRFILFLPSVFTRLNHRNSVRTSVRPSHGWISQKRCRLG